MLVKNRDPLLLNSSGTMIGRMFLTEKRKEYLNYGEFNSHTNENLKESRKIHEFKNVWTSDGKMLFKDGSGIINLFYD